MGLTRLPEIAALAPAPRPRDRKRRSAVIAQGTLPEERVVVGTLGTIAGEVDRAGLRAPATIVVGEAVRLRERLHRLTEQNFCELLHASYRS